MKMQLKFTLLLLAALFIIFTGFKKDNRFFSAANSFAVQTANTLTPTSTSVSSLKPEEIFFTTTTLTSKGAPPEVVKTGSYTGSEQLGTSGTYVMTIDYHGMAIHCTTVFTPATGGQFTTFSECQMATFTGQWRIIDGEGDYANLQGNGSIIMKPGHEYCVGRLF